MSRLIIDLDRREQKMLNIVPAVAWVGLNPRIASRRPKTGMLVKSHRGSRGLVP